MKRTHNGIAHNRMEKAYKQMKRIYKRMKKIT